MIQSHKIIQFGTDLRKLSVPIFSLVKVVEDFRMRLLRAFGILSGVESFQGFDIFPRQSVPMTVTIWSHWFSLCLLCHFKTGCCSQCLESCNLSLLYCLQLIKQIWDVQPYTFTWKSNCNSKEEHEYKPICDWFKPINNI